MARLSDEAVNAMAAAYAVLLNGGQVQIYSGKQPAAPSTALTTQTLLATLRLHNPAFGPPASGLIQGVCDPELSAPATGRATWFRATKADGVTGVMDGTVGALGSGEDMEIPNPQIVQGTQVLVTESTFQVPRGF